MRRAAAGEHGRGEEDDALGVGSQLSDVAARDVAARHSRVHCSRAMPPRACGPVGAQQARSGRGGRAVGAQVLEAAIWILLQVLLR